MMQIKYSPDVEIEIRGALKVIKVAKKGMLYERYN